MRHVIFLSALLLAACGGGKDDSVSPTPVFLPGSGEPGGGGSPSGGTGGSGGGGSAPVDEATAFAEAVAEIGRLLQIEADPS